jgi:hypothetical protein
MPTVIIKPTPAYVLDKLTLCFNDSNTESVNKTAGLLIDYDNKKWLPGYMVTANARYRWSPIYCDV